MGSATAYHLASRRARVIGFEGFGPAHDRGSSHGESRIIRQAYFEDPCYVPLLLRAYELWRDLERKSGSELLRVTRGMMLGIEASAAVSGSVASCRQWNLPHRVLTAAEVRREFPAFAPGPDVLGVLEPMAGVLRPEEAILSHLRLAAAAGAELRFWTRVTGWEPRGSTIEVATESGRQRLDRLIITAGPWTSQLLAGWSLPLEVERQLMVWLAPRRPEEFDPQRFPVFLYEPPTGLPLYGFPSLDSRSVKVACHHGGERTTPASLRRDWDEAEALKAREGLAALLPGLSDAPLVTAKVCMYTDTPDLHFAIGAHPQDERVQVACGFSGHGFKFSTVIGEIMAELALDGRTRHPIEPLRASRLS
jgi:sarcosine oxidase